MGFISYRGYGKSRSCKKCCGKERITEKVLQDKFGAAAKIAENSYWLSDGVHPTAMGHELIKREWIECFKTL